MGIYRWAWAGRRCLSGPCSPAGGARGGQLSHEQLLSPHYGAGGARPRETEASTVQWRWCRTGAPVTGITVGRCSRGGQCKARVLGHGARPRLETSCDRQVSVPRHQTELYICAKAPAPILALEGSAAMPASAQPREGCPNSFLGKKLCLPHVPAPTGREGFPRRGCEQTGTPISQFTL